MRMREYVARMSAKRIAKALRCPYEWHKPLSGRPSPQCGYDVGCDTCIEKFGYGTEVEDFNLRQVVSRMPAAQMAGALRCPYDWFEPLMDKKPVCEYGADCTKCILHFLIGCDDSEFRDAE